MTALASVFRRRSDVRYRVIQQEAVVVRQSGPEVLVLNEVGARVLDLVDGHAPVSDLVARMRGEFDVDEARLQGDVIRFLGELAQAGVIEEVAAG